MLLQTQAADLAGPDFGLRRSALRAQWRPDVIRWDQVTRLSSELQELAWGIASQASYAEQVGLLAAAALVTEVDDFSRLSLATAVADEAKHAEVFARYALHRGGRLLPPDRAVVRLDAAMHAIQDHLGRFFVHTGLEWMAADQMYIYAKMFEGDILADIYALVRRDELRHVALGIGYLSRRLCKGDVDRSWLAHYEGVLFEAAGMNDDLFELLAPFVGMTARELRRWWMKRHARRMSRLMRSQKGAQT